MYSYYCLCFSYKLKSIQRVQTSTVDNIQLCNSQYYMFLWYPNPKRQPLYMFGYISNVNVFLHWLCFATIQFYCRLLDFKLNGSVDHRLQPCWESFWSYPVTRIFSKFLLGPCYTLPLSFMAFLCHGRLCAILLTVRQTPEKQVNKQTHQNHPWRR